MADPKHQPGKLPRSEIVVFIRGENVFVYEYYSHGMIEKVIKLAQADGNLVLNKLCRSMCG